MAVTPSNKKALLSKHFRYIFNFNKKPYATNRINYDVI